MHVQVNLVKKEVHSEDLCHCLKHFNVKGGLDDLVKPTYYTENGAQTCTTNFSALTDLTGRQSLLWDPRTDKGTYYGCRVSTSEPCTFPVCAIFELKKGGQERHVSWCPNGTSIKILLLFKNTANLWPLQASRHLNDARLSAPIDPVKIYMVQPIVGSFTWWTFYYFMANWDAKCYVHWRSIYLRSSEAGFSHKVFALRWIKAQLDLPIIIVMHVTI